jgi:hypothetical protein
MKLAKQVRKATTRKTPTKPKEGTLKENYIFNGPHWIGPINLKFYSPDYLLRWIEDHYLSAPDWEIDLIKDYLSEVYNETSTNPVYEKDWEISEFNKKMREQL